MPSSSSRRRLAASVSSVMNINAVYFPNYCLYQGHTPAQLNYDCINMVFYAHATVGEDGGIYLSDKLADVQAPCDGVTGGLGSLLHLKQSYSHLQVILAIGGSQSAGEFPMVASNPILRENFARSAQGLVEASGLDGISIDWEYPSSPQQGADFAALLATVRNYLPGDRYFVTASLPAGRAVLQTIDFRFCAQYLDFVNLMAYDIFGPWSTKCGYHAQLYNPNPGKEDSASGADAVQFLMAQGFPGKKILLGVPLFGRSFLDTKGPGHKFKAPGGVNGEGSFEYRDLPRKGTKEQVDRKAVAALCVGGDGGFVTYDNPETVKMKATFCKQKGLGGLFYWAAHADSRESKRSLISTGFKALHSA